MIVTIMMTRVMTGITVIVAPSALPMLPQNKKMVVRIMMTRMRIAMITIIVAPSALPMLPNGTLEVQLQKREVNEDHHDDEGG